MELFDAVKREWTTLNVLLRAKHWLDPVTNDSTDLVADDLEAAIDRYSDHVAFRFEGTVTTYGELEIFANRVAHWAVAEGLQPGDVAALFMENRPEYVAIWLGLSKVGVIPALINHNLAGDALSHCISIAGSRVIITGTDQDEQIRSTPGLASHNLPVWSFGGDVGEDFARALASQPSARPSRERRQRLTNRDNALFLFTSGTTGLPKAARMSHARVRSMMRTFIAPCHTTAHDRVYLTLPLYHATGGLCGVGIALYTGAQVVLRRRFSASHFWDDCADQKVTTIVYIGELCRYLVNQAPHPKERSHHVRCGFGNGLRADIWDEFRTRFNIPTMVEFYGSTEGNVKFMNFDGKVGACGRIPPYAKSRFDHVAFVKFDVEAEAPVRGEDGFCVRAGIGETGEAIGRIGEDAGTRFEGYNDSEASRKKILRDVFEKGDKWFRTGDLMRQGEHGYIYFVDRIGDTYRWKGENVATNEVAEVLSRAPGISTANVYGVPVPGTDGKAGMASVTTDGDVDYVHLRDWLAERLPNYAIPLFIRVQSEPETTGTFKFRKVDLVEEGFDPDTVQDPVWFADPKSGHYEPLTHDAYEEIEAGGVRF